MSVLIATDEINPVAYWLKADMPKAVRKKILETVGTKGWKSSQYVLSYGHDKSVSVMVDHMDRPGSMKLVIDGVEHPLTIHDAYRILEFWTAIVGAIKP